MSDPFQLHELQHARLPCPSLLAGVCSDSCTLSWCRYITISSSAAPFFCPASVDFPSSALHIRWPKCWSFSISPSNEYSELISFRINWFDILDVQGTLKSLLQHQNSKVSLLECSAFFMVICT